MFSMLAGRCVGWPCSGCSRSAIAAGAEVAGGAGGAGAERARDADARRLRGRVGATGSGGAPRRIRRQPATDRSASQRAAGAQDAGRRGARSRASTASRCREGAGADADTILVAADARQAGRRARADFDRRIDGFTAKAREDYLVNRQTYVAPEQVELSQIYRRCREAGRRGGARASRKRFAPISRVAPTSRAWRRSIPMTRRPRRTAGRWAGRRAPARSDAREDRVRDEGDRRNQRRGSHAESATLSSVSTERRPPGRRRSTKSRTGSWRN